MLKVNREIQTTELNCNNIPLTTHDPLYNVHGNVFLMTFRHQYFTEFIIKLLNLSYTPMSDVIVPKKNDVSCKGIISGKLNHYAKKT